MTRAKLQKMTVQQLVDRFETIALEQGTALLYDEIGQYNRLYDEMDALEEELKGRTGDQRQALIPLLGHANTQVRLKAAFATLALVPKEARQALQAISDADAYPEAAYARDILDGLDDGTYTPS